MWKLTTYFSRDDSLIDSFFISFFLQILKLYHYFQQNTEFYLN